MGGVFLKGNEVENGSKILRAQQKIIISNSGRRRSQSFPYILIDDGNWFNMTIPKKVKIIYIYYSY